MRNIVSLILVTMMGAFGTLLWVQHDGDATPPVPKPTPPVAPAVAPSGKTAEKPEPARPALHRALRTVSLGWEFLAPGVVSNDGSTPGKASAYQAAGLETSFSNANSMDEIESALAKGGNEAGGADIAIVPLSSYVASFERLRALSPEVVFVIGWSRGRESLYGADTNALARLPATGNVHLVATAGQPETFLALCLLELAGVPASRVELADHETTGSLTAAFRGPKPKPTGKLLVTSADTPHLMPIVAVVPRGFIQAHASELEVWARIWIAGVHRLDADVPAGGRQVAGITGAPPVLGIIEALGQVEFASLRENAAALGLSGRGALTLDTIFKTSWRLWRDSGLITTPAPDRVPLHTELVASLVRSDPSAVVELPPARSTAADAASKRPEVLLAVRAPMDATKLDPEAFVARIGFVAGMFDRLPLRIGVRDDVKTAQLLADTARERFGLRAAQLSTAKRPPAGMPGAIEILSGR